MCDTGHVTKSSDIAGPKIIEHMVDAVLRLEGDMSQSYRYVCVRVCVCVFSWLPPVRELRGMSVKDNVPCVCVCVCVCVCCRLLRAGKNRFGTTDEVCRLCSQLSGVVTATTRVHTEQRRVELHTCAHMHVRVPLCVSMCIHACSRLCVCVCVCVCVTQVGVFTMDRGGLHAVANPSAMFLANRSNGSSAVAVILDGTRVLVLEVQVSTHMCVQAHTHTHTHTQHRHSSSCAAATQCQAHVHAHVTLQMSVHTHTRTHIHTHKPMPMCMCSCDTAIKLSWR